MGPIVGLILFGIPSAIIAKKKGFKSLRWLIALGLIGLIVVAFLPSGEAKGISADEAWERVERGDRVGAWMAGINLALGFILFIIFAVANS